MYVAEKVQLLEASAKANIEVGVMTVTIGAVTYAASFTSNPVLIVPGAFAIGLGLQKIARGAFRKREASKLSESLERSIMPEEFVKPRLRDVLRSEIQNMVKANDNKMANQGSTKTHKALTTKQAFLTGVAATVFSFGVQTAILAYQNPLAGRATSYLVNATAQALGFAHNLVPSSSPVLIGVEGMLLSLGIGAATTAVLTYLAHRASKKEQSKEKHN